MNAIVKNTELSGDVLPFDPAELQEREQRIERAQRNAYYEIGLELAFIRDRRLYKKDFATFEDYCKERWDWTPQRAGQLIRTAEAAQKIEKILSISPSRESHVQVLLEKLDTDEDRALAWQKVVRSAGNERITAKLVEQTIEEYLLSKNREYLTLSNWKAMSQQEQASSLIVAHDKSKKFNDQDNASIEWARWSWNPITGCKHDCPYCYARDIAARFYVQGFEPSIYPARLSAPRNTNVPDKAAQDISYKNVFTGSMADVFGRWVPQEWIDAVLAQISASQQWNFLLLTKFPKRMSEFVYPENAWLGTSVDLQARVVNAERAMQSVEAAVRWLSIEPLIEPLTFSQPKLFQWVVIGGASASTQTPAWTPPFEWIARLYCQFKDAGAKVYLKDNIGFDGPNRPRGFPTWSDPDARSAADVMHYLRNARSIDQKAE